MFQKLMLTLRTKLMYLDNKDLINEILGENILVSTLAKEELLKRDLNNLEENDKILSLIINKLTIEELWNIVNLGYDNHFTKLVTKKLNYLLDYYEKLNIIDFLSKKNEDKIKLYQK